MYYGAKVEAFIFGGGQRSFGVTRGQKLKTLLTRYLQIGSLDRFHTSMWMRYGAKMNAFIFGGGQRSPGVTVGQTLKTLLTRYLQMHHGKRKNPIVFGGGQRSFGVTRGQTLKTLFTRYLKVGSLDRFHTLLLSMLMHYGEKMNAFIFRGG
ncbi:hypothetical protein HOLleu_00462 [Holothuria leucospilota]|uniref:Uncharacterized protein n=1 Tax=Holothuria leucospilota TaxID=206669 RepID=A0A9Q1CP49_HOLLE|nr:hypothetical protein HOLleu_00462 [Holothuria leucospilota]